MEARHYCGDLYRFGDGVAKDDHLAFVYYKKAALLGDADAQNSLGDAYDKGGGVPQSYDKAFQSAVQGNSVAQFNLGIFYRDGRGCEQSFEHSVKWFENAAVQGHSATQCSLGVAYQIGRGAPQSYDKAFEHYHQSAAQPRKL